MHEDFATMLERGAPAVSDSDGIRRELVELASATRSATRTSRRHRARMIAIPVIGICLTVGGVTAAAASPALQGFLATHPHLSIPLPWSTKNDCVNTVYLGADTQVPAPANAATIAQARKDVATIDFNNIKNSKAWKTAAAAASARAALQPTGYGSRKETESFFQYVAYTDLVDRMITSQLQKDGVDTSGLTVMGGTSCHRVN